MVTFMHNKDYSYKEIRLDKNKISGMGIYHAASVEVWQGNNCGLK